jgi:NADH-quinone oxidoreductase subunit E
MLSQAEREEIEAEFGHYPAKSAVSVDALKIVQRHRGWVSDEALRDVAALLEMSPDELDNVATFYSLIYRKPVGRHVILVCDSITCWIMGYDRVVQALSERLKVKLGETSADGRFTLLPIVCLGTCDHAPALMIDEDLYRDVDPARLEQILERYP